MYHLTRAISCQVPTNTLYPLKLDVDGTSKLTERPPHNHKQHLSICAMNLRSCPGTCRDRRVHRGQNRWCLDYLNGTFRSRDKSQGFRVELLNPPICNRGNASGGQSLFSDPWKSPLPKQPKVQEGSPGTARIQCGRRLLAGFQLRGGAAIQGPHQLGHLAADASDRHASVRLPDTEGKCPIRENRQWLMWRGIMEHASERSNPLRRNPSPNDQQSRTVRDPAQPSNKRAQSVSSRTMQRLMFDNQNMPQKNLNRLNKTSCT